MAGLDPRLSGLSASALLSTAGDARCISSWRGPAHFCPVELGFVALLYRQRRFSIVMAGLGPAIHDFGGASREVDGRHKADHDDEEAPVYDTNFYRTAVVSAPPSTSLPRQVKTWMAATWPAMTVRTATVPYHA